MLAASPVDASPYAHIIGRPIEHVPQARAANRAFDLRPEGCLQAVSCNERSLASHRTTSACGDKRIEVDPNAARGEGKSVTYSSDNGHEETTFNAPGVLQHVIESPEG